jgi:redox-sensitive bicupin YhaK (pirin superfamily)
MTRREALELLGAAGVAAATGCTPSSGPAAEFAVEPSLGADAITEIGALGQPPWPTRDPFLFCVHHDDHYPAGNGRFGPAASLAGRRIGYDFEGIDGWRMYHGQAVPGFPSHPHRGFETVTVLRRGLIDHSDSLGAAARYGAGDVQWLTAGRGIQHAEMFPLLRQDDTNPVELFQIWLNLPRADKMAEPHFSMLWRESIPRRVDRDSRGGTTEVTVVAGRLGELVPPSPPPSSYGAKPGSDLAIWTLVMSPEARWTLPPASAGTNRRLYFFRGSSLRVGGRPIPRNSYVDLRGDAVVTLESGAEATELLLLQGRPIGEPVAQYGPFVMNSHAEIRQAFLDYQRTRFGGWPWSSDEPVHGEEGRFARHVDGRVERPA